MVAYGSLALPLFAGLAYGAASISQPATTYPPLQYSSSASTSSPPGVTVSYAPSPDRNTAQATTSLTDIPAFTPSFTEHGPVSAETKLPSPTKSALPSCKKVQYDYAAGAGSNASRANAVKEAFLYAWNAYKQYAFPKDQLLPLTKGGTQVWYGWSVTTVEALDTAIVMNLTDVVSDQLAYIETIDFTETKYSGGVVEIFDTNIRYIGGLLSAYDMLKSGQFYNSYQTKQIEALLSQAISLANKVAIGFDTPSGLPAGLVNFTSDTPVEETFTTATTHTVYNSTNTASCGTFILEFGRLSDLSGNETYRQLAQRAEYYIVNPHPKPVYPGLTGSQLDTTNGQMLTYDGGWHADVDSAMEYLIKYFQYSPTPIAKEYKNYWLTAVQSTIEHLAVAPQGFPDLKFISALTVNGSVSLSEDSFTCFAGGNFLLGGALLGRSDIIQLGIEATNSCHQTYNQTLTGLGPTEWSWYDPQGNAYHVIDDNDAAERSAAAQMGFFIDNDDGNADGDAEWEFRPEHLESLFYAHRITGDPVWADFSWDIFQSIEKYSKNDVAYAAVNNVNMPFGGNQDNVLDSFFFAEVLKYLYLTFSDPTVIDLNQWVFNTECHPFLVQCGIGNVDDYSETAAGAKAAPATGTTAATGKATSSTTTAAGKSKGKESSKTTTTSAAKATSTHH